MPGSARGSSRENSRDGRSRPSGPAARPPRAPNSVPPPPARRTFPVWTLAAAGIVGAGIALAVATVLRPGSGPAAEPAGPTATSRGVHVGRPGPWGRLERYDIALELPSGYAQPDLCKPDLPEWRFPGRTAEEMRAFLDGAVPDPDQRAAITSTLECDPAFGCIARPPMATVASLAPDVRGLLYETLGQEMDNLDQKFALRATAEEWEARFRETGLPSGIRDHVRSLLYPVEGRLLFADYAAVCSRLRTNAERVAFVKSFSATDASVVMLHVPSAEAAASLAEWWGRGNNRKDVEPLLRSVGALPGGGWIDVAHLLPAFARGRLYTFADPTGPRYDCFWTALNFLSDRPDDAYVDGTEAARAFREDYRRVAPEEARLGDIILFLTASGDPLHAAVFIADDIVFSKNGGAFRRPWVLTTMEVLAERYIPGGENSLRYLRRFDH